jgi:hypothetical protein
MTALTRTEKDLLRVLEKGCRDAAEEYRKAASKAVENQHPVEADIYCHLATRLSKPFASLEEVSDVLSEWRELGSWVPVPERLRKLSLKERKALLFHRIRRLKLKPEDEDRLIELATQQPGRPRDGREVAVRALELRMTGQKWEQIEPQLLPHRQDVANPGRSINRQVQFLNSVLKRYGVHFGQVRDLSSRTR